MFRIIVESKNHHEPIVDWIVNALQFKQVKFRKRTTLSKKNLYITEFENAVKDDE